MKKRNSSKKTTRTIKVDLGQNMAVRGIAQDRSGRLFVIGIDGRSIPVKSATVEEGYDTGRADKPRKTISEINISHDYPKIHIELHLLEFSHILFVDTNTRTINDEVVAVTGIVSGIRSGLLDAKGKPIINLRQEICYEFRNPTQPAEQIGWHYAMKHFALGNLKGKLQSVAVITDHDIRNLDAFNNMKKRIAGIAYKPKEYKLIYACADRGGSRFINMGMNMADWTAKNSLDLIAANLENTQALQIAQENEPFSHMRALKPTKHVPYLDLSEAKKYKPKLFPLAE